MIRPVKSEWSVEAIHLLRVLWLDRSVPLDHIPPRLASETGAVVSRDAVCGKARRLGLAQRSSLSKPATERPVKSRPPAPIRRKPARAAARPERRAPDAVSAFLLHRPGPAVVDFAGLGPGHCRFPVGEAVGLAQLFCGAAKEDHSSYCAAHAALAFQAAPNPQAPAPQRVICAPLAPLAGG